MDDALLISEEYIQVQYSKKYNNKVESSHSNLIIAAYVTAHARCELYKLLNNLGKRVVYFDTDSVLFIQTANEWKPETGYYLGQLTDEVATLKEPYNYITKFVSLGAKSYAYEVLNPQTNSRKYTCKIKGLTLNFVTSNVINFNTMKTLLEEFVKTKNRTSVSVPQFNIKSTKFYEVISNYGTKICRVTYDRRIVKPDLTTLPFGFDDSI